MRDFRKLEIWNLAMDIVEQVYQLVKTLPNSELFGASLQMRKAVISMPSNIAEGCSRSSSKEISHYFEISIGSAFELETQLIACTRIGYFDAINTDPIIASLHMFQKKTNSYIQTMRR